MTGTQESAPAPSRRNRHAAEAPAYFTADQVDGMDPVDLADLLNKSMVQTTALRQRQSVRATRNLLVVAMIVGVVLGAAFSFVAFLLYERPVVRAMDRQTAAINSLVYELRQAAAAENLLDVVRRTHDGE